MLQNAHKLLNQLNIVSSSFFTFKAEVDRYLDECQSRQKLANMHILVNTALQLIGPGSLAQNLFEYALEYEPFLAVRDGQVCDLSCT